MHIFSVKTFITSTLFTQDSSESFGFFLLSILWVLPVQFTCSRRFSLNGEARRQLRLGFQLITKGISCAISCEYGPIASDFQSAVSGAKHQGESYLSGVINKAI